jgi:signal recognition particle subunit SRP54
MYEMLQFQSSYTDPLGEEISMMPGFNQAQSMPKLGRDEKESEAKKKKFMTMMDSMTGEELDSTNPKLMTDSRVYRIAGGSGRSLREVHEMLEAYKEWRSTKIGHKISKTGAMSRNMNAQQMSRVLPPYLLRQLQNLMRNFNGRSRGGDMPE